MDNAAYDRLEGDMERYCRSLRPANKRAYARDFTMFLLPWVRKESPYREPSPRAYGLSAMGAQAVRLEVFAILRQHEKAAGIPHPD